MTPGEKAVFEFFNAHLDPAWEIYLQPYLNGLKPDIVLLHAKVGIAVFEVKDWNLDGGAYEIDSSGLGAPRLIVRTPGGRRSKTSPLAQVLGYQREIRDLYCPRLDGQQSLAVITAGVIFTSATTERVTAFFQDSIGHHFGDTPEASRYHPVVGMEALAEGRLDAVFPEANRTSSRFMSPELADDFRNWLVEPAVVEEQRTLPALTEQQRDLIGSRTATGFRRVKGAAGSGKSLVLAGRAAQLANQGKEVLVVCFNITLLNYLRKQAARWRTPNQSITWLSFHQWAKRVCLDSQASEAYKDLWRGRREDEDLGGVLGARMAAVVHEAMKDHEDWHRYDAVLVDEGQDFLPSWWGCLREVRKDGGEMVLVADATQDLYDTAKNWTDQAMAGAGFVGPWVHLEESFRLPPAVLKIASAFAKDFLPEGVDHPRMRQTELSVFPCRVAWRNVDGFAGLANACVQELRAMVVATEAANLAISDVVFLASDNELGRQVTDALEALPISVANTFHADSRTARQQKLKFFLGPSRVKATTVHSFKGWEGRAVVVAIQRARTPSELAAIYVALTRVVRHARGSFLAVVNAEPALAAFGDRVNRISNEGSQFA